MKEKEIQGSCISCDSQFAIPVSELKDYMACPVCGNEADITVICPHCDKGILTNGRALSCSVPCPECNKDFIWNTVKSTDGTPMVVSMTGRFELHDMASMLSIMRENLEKTEKASRPKQNISYPHTNAIKKGTEPQGCLSSIVAIWSLVSIFMIFIFFILIN